ncbi:MULTISPECIES: NAD(P)H-dependent oxidoreductase [Niallia]|uniref:NAD(P)H-dependent oxidoreductase n=1 Tax=Niallia TaxID=2837506 RepID=UPI000BA64C7F|nr:NAD(P)H-dependent oxidoreductase [Niallia circulans]PAD25777.1 hypothetical protein CHH62_10765 [Niallia circulans]PAE12787.1 hypothetical protein CHI02_07865 [Niallia circulans]
MNVLIIFTHPSKESLNGALLKNVLEGCRENGFIKDIQLLDLYEENFNPILYFDEKNKRRHMHKNLMKKTVFQFAGMKKEGTVCYMESAGNKRMLMPSRHKHSFIILYCSIPESSFRYTCNKIINRIFSKIEYPWFIYCYAAFF